MTDIKNGQFEEYYENGQLKSKGTYKDGKLDGLYEAYSRDGRLSQKSTYKDGILDGPFEDYWKNGQLMRKCIYKDGIYKDGRIDGPLEVYYSNGQLSQLYIYKNGEVIDEKDRFLTPEEVLPDWEKKHPNPTTEDFLGYMYGTGGNVITCIVRAESETLEKFFPVDKWATMESIPELKKIFAGVPREKDLMKTMLQLDNKLRTTYNLNKRKQERQQQKLATAQHHKQQGDAR